MKYNRSNKKLKNNVIFSSIYQLLVIIVPIVTTPYVTRIFNTSQMGDYSLSLATSSLFVIISQFGLETYGNREIAKSKTNIDRTETFFQLLSIQTIISILIFALYNIIFIFILNTGNTQLYFIQSLLILVNIFDISWYFIGIEEIKKTIFRNALTKIFVTLSIFIFIKDGNQLGLYALFNVLGMLIGNLTMVFSSRHYVNYRHAKFNISKKHLKGSFKLLIPRLLNSSSNTIENSVLKIATTSSNVGIYSQAKKINNLLFAVINSAINALSPRMSYYVSNNDSKKIKNVFYKGLLYSSFFSIVFISGIFSVSHDFVGFFFGEGYELVAPVLQIVSLSLLFIPTMTLISRGILIPYNKDKEFTNSVVIILVSTVLFNLLLNPIFGALGAGIAYNISQLLSFLYTLYVSRNLIDITQIFKYLLFSAICIIGNVYVTNKISDIIIINNSFLSFIIFGMISLIISTIMILIIKYYRNYLSNKLK